ncbi:membrane protein [Planotetraspora thailandica]|uniref:Membrane protein n=1 Tax=Planotetraspora thailandica TaxID=487172 RepID=A0A8J3XWU9_9ACTN|nr:MMPL family transporter [Planotetraspora thailandica]GII55310.1 membrane protein [Planotetraspora thailandica]
MLLESKSAGRVRRPLTVRVAAWSAAHPWRAIIAWLVLVVVCLGAGSLAGTHNATGEDYRVGEAGVAEAIAADGGLALRPVERVLISARSGSLDMTAATAVAQDVTDRMNRLSEVDSVAPPVRAADGEALVVTVTMKGAELDGKKKVDALLAQTAAVQRAHPDLRVEETGSPSIGKGVDQQRGDDLALSEAITVPVTLVTLLVVFGSVVMAGVPLLLALSSIAAAMGLSMLVSHVVPDAGVGNNVIVLIGLAVGVDYTLFYLKREREERARAGGTLSPEALVEIAAATSGRMIVISGLAVIVSTATLYLASDVIFASLATGTIIVVLVAVISAMTALPALLVLIGRRAERRTAKRSDRRERAGSARVWNAILWPASRHPVITLCVSTLLMIGLALPVLGMQLRVLNKDSHSREVPAMQTYDRLTSAFPELRVTHNVVVRSDPGRAAEVGGALGELNRLTRSDPLFAGHETPRLRTSADGTVSLLELSVPYKLSSSEAQESLTRIRDVYLPDTVGTVPGAEAAVTGDVARDTDYLANQNEKLPLVLGCLLLLTFAMTAIVFRSAVIGLLGVVLNVLSAAAAFGVLTMAFQSELGRSVFGTEATGAIGSRVPLFLLVILFGLSMDYQVFVVSRIREAALLGLPTPKAVLDGLGRSAGVVTSAAIVMVTVFASFVLLHLAEMKQIGFSLATAVLLDAFVIRVMILPSALTLLHKVVWWPSREPLRARLSPRPAVRER